MRLAGKVFLCSRNARPQKALVDARTLNTQPSPHVKGVE
jgi:hypothetical protein